MEACLHILHLEDNPRDAELIRDSLEADGIACEIDRVETRQEFQAALEKNKYDLVLSDYTLPAFDGLTALQIANQHDPNVPFIFVSGTIGEDRAVESLKNGAVDYVLKDRLPRMVAAVRRALAEARERAERRHIEEELRQRNELFRQITENVDDLIAVLDLEGRRVFNSPSYRKLFGKPDNLVGTDSFADIHPDDRERIRKIFSEAVASGIGQRAEYRFLLPDGTSRHVESQGSAIRDKQGKVTHVVVVSRDVTEREQSAMKIREQAALLEQAQDAIYVRNLDHQITFWNKGAELVYGWTSEEVLNNRAAMMRFWPDLSQRDEIWETVLQQGNWIGEVTQATKNGGEITVTSRRTLLRDPAGKPVAILNINTDITEKKQLESQFLRSQRLENIGALAGGIAHDLNNVLAPALMVADIIRDELQDESSRRMMDTVKASAQRGSDLVKQILQFAHGVKGEPVPFHLRHLVKDIETMARNTFPKSIQIKTAVARDLQPVLADATQLHQVLLNLCVNARDAMPGGGVLSIEAANTVLDQKTFPTQPQPVSGPFVRLSVSDTGTGIPPEIIGKIFLPFFTTKAPGKGTGLGLSTVAGIVRSHKGFIEYSSEMNKGTTCDVYFPVTELKDTAAPGAPVEPAPVGHGEWILLADDERAVLEMTKETLEAYHYHVLSAKNGAEAFMLFAQHKDKIAAVVTDLMMPIMDGPTLIRGLRQASPTIKIICVSGLTSKTKLDQVNRADVQSFLRKPFIAQELLFALHKTLAAT